MSGIDCLTDDSRKSIFCGLGYSNIDDDYDHIWSSDWKSDQRNWRTIFDRTSEFADLNAGPDIGLQDTSLYTKTVGVMNSGVRRFHETAQSFGVAVVFRCGDDELLMVEYPRYWNGVVEWIFEVYATTKKAASDLRMLLTLMV